RWKAKWPRWTPPAEMVKRDPMAAKWANGMPGGPTNPLGARALYLFQGKVDTLYRIHGTADPRSIGRAVSSGCIRLLNVDVADLYERVTPGARVVVLQGRSRRPERLAKPVKTAPRQEAREETSKPKAPIVKRNFNLN
ncbi:MAG TPA: L,D-transpeptidase, partial [Nordella sp.]|nr:L,D-transpeptidase [Nordella sp.]